MIIASLTLALVSVLAFSSYAFFDSRAAEEDARKTVAMPPEWSACTSNADCRFIQIRCGASIGIRQDHITDANKKIDDKFGPFHGCDSTVILPTSAICEDGQCHVHYEWDK